MKKRRTRTDSDSESEDGHEQRQSSQSQAGGQPIARMPSAQPDPAFSGDPVHQAPDPYAHAHASPEATPPGEPVVPGYGSTATETETRDHHIQRALEGTDTTQDEVPDTVLDVLGEGGKPLEQPIQRALEERMGADFSNVRIHTGGRAAQAADAIDAKAFTCGNDIVFNAGKYDPESGEGQFLLAHELAHVRQQTGAAISMMPQEGAALEIDPDPQLERDADEAAQQALSGDEPLIVNRMGTNIHIQRTGAGAPVPGAGGPLVEQIRELEDDTEDDEGITLRKLLKGAAKAGISTGIITALVQTSALETGLTDPETAMITGAASVTAATGLTAKRLAYRKLDPQIWRRIFAAAGHEDLLANILRNLGHEPDWAEDLGTGDSQADELGR
ncbi:hypothetical protein C483_00899 [Natrialba hulunbeirensis JCM 10989]|uniref:eCIS core domain-containing protein n=1 Tax=Natrialba hulunbeirensis JCM 10989 TaxID=1227493 RepID=M0AAU8_9EURY|nr:DUF4157 domain-containing protein [Natrialba hulunbeirensis]ELY95659.1 hypothetical protein C483_00899 [Natrialba hulunbeirensis JCM 10989]